jgi:predicted GNAT family acetyltransferase
MPDVRHNPEAHRFEAGTGTELAKLNYRMRGEAVEMLHVEVPEAYQGHGLAGKLAAAALHWARDSGLKVVPTCPYVKGYIAKNPQYADLVPAN